MNFFEHQARARRSSTRLVVLFALAVAGIVVAVDLAVLFFSGGWGPNSAAVMLLFTVLTLAVIGLGSLYRVASLRGGGEAVALQLGGREVPADTRDLQLRRLRNVVEEIAIASGVPMPKLYVLEEESGINAFAAGYSPADAAIAVTRGCLERLNRDELQGVIAHEFSHILNGDMRLNIRLMGVLFGILMLSVIGRKVLQLGVGRRSRDLSVVLVMGVAALVIGSIGVFFGRLIKAAVSRQRELLADASAVQFTRQTAGLVGALKKIGGLSDGSTLRDEAGAEEVSHMLFGEGRAFSRWFATHPPLPERIRLLDPSFRPEQLQQLQTRWRAAPPDGLEEDRLMGLDGGLAPASRAAPPPLPRHDAGMALDPAQVSAQVASPGDDDYRRASQLSGSLPEDLRVLARDREAAMPLLMALLLDADAGIAARQRGEIEARMGAGLADRSAELARRLASLHPALRLPLASLTFAALRAQPRPQLQLFLDTIDALSHADGRVSLFEYCLSRLLQVQVRAALDPSQHLHFGRRKTTGVRREFATLLAVVAQAGHPDSPMEAQRAYLAGLQRVLPQDHLPYAPPAAGVLALDAVWAPLDALDPLAKQVLVESVTATIGHNHRVSVAEAELLRTICGVLHCPLPAMLQVA
ncbi:M48 family metallopeptidase [Flavobacterium sp. MXW15]|uniref:M48 family metallopeptidase n=1 Tax=Xanthomonas chitinilytica TaxID=2989819 RepID=A0ABT3K0D7_9XANT|nr:M48 family metallopeptidase [Xanthomonas sp. H13-6]MCW4456231.1 M48 family metallopeptidase [Flavobacterium sp. MXW15]MCW4473885.1 M48 family metallopeptidase [Xanthomonas sp. H13-6]